MSYLQEDPAAASTTKAQTEPAGVPGQAPMMQNAASQLGGSMLQRKIARRAQAQGGAQGGGKEGPQGKEGPEGNDDAVFGGVSRAVAVAKTWLVSSPGRYKETVVAKLGKGELVDLVDLGAGEKFNQVGDPKYKWWKVKVSRGAHVGQEGWVMATLLTSVYTVKDAGTTQTDKIGAGEVTVGTGQTIDADGAAFGDNMFSLTYQGKDADKMRFLQFLWREIIGVDDKGKASPQTATFTNSVGRSYELTQGGTGSSYGTPTKANWNTDTAHATDPFYEAGGAADRTADSATMMDQPGAAVGNVTKAFDDGAKSVVSRAHFSTFLVKDEKEVQSKTNIHVEWKFASKAEATGSPKGKHTAATGAAAALSPATLVEAFHDQFPTYKTLK